MEKERKMEEGKVGKSEMTSLEDWKEVQQEISRVEDGTHPHVALMEMIEMIEKQKV